MGSSEDVVGREDPSPIHDFLRIWKRVGEKQRRGIEEGSAQM